VSLALVVNSGELVGGVSFPAPVLLCAAPVLFIAFDEAVVAAVCSLNPGNGTVVVAPGLVKQSGKSHVSRCTCRRGQVGG
jgi:hypothetical protein